MQGGVPKPNFELLLAVFLVYTDSGLVLDRGDTHYHVSSGVGRRMTTLKDYSLTEIFGIGILLGR